MILELRYYILTHQYWWNSNLYKDSSTIESI